MEEPPLVGYVNDVRPDIDYTKKLLEVLESFPTATCDVQMVQGAGIDIAAPEFFFHIKLLEDRGLLQGADPEHPEIYKYTDRGRQVFWTRAPMRLTADGHDFAAALRTSNILETIKTSLKEAAFSTWVSTAGGLATAYAMRQVGLTP